MPFTTLPNWLTFAALRGHSAPALATAADQSAALQRADDYIRLSYTARFSPAIDLAEPTVAAALAEAVHLAALEELASPFQFAATFAPSDVKTLTKVGEIEWDVLPMAESDGGDLYQIKSPAIEALMRPYLSAAYLGEGAAHVGAMVV